jgi:hypothetical protein
MPECCMHKSIHAPVPLQRLSRPPSMCMKALDPKKSSRLQLSQRCKPRRQYQATSISLGSKDSLWPLSMLHDHAASPARCRLRLVRNCPLGHVHGADPREASGWLFEFHWHSVLPCLLCRHAHYPVHPHHLCPFLSLL